MLKDFFKLEETEEEMIRVNHAGELGAKQIYLGQLKALNNDVEILEMLESELEHLEYFEEKIKQTGVRPSLLNAIWKPSAFLMGYLSGKIGGRKIAMLCTEKVEEVIEKHYESQIAILENSELKDKIIKFRAEEIAHMKIGKIEGRESELIGKLFSGLTKLAIVLSKKI
jgi:ubiquinone biosynthesis monooxygenase Coq7